MIGPYFHLTVTPFLLSPFMFALLVNGFNYDLKNKRLIKMLILSITILFIFKVANMRRFRKAKIIATLGPLTSTEEAITKLFEAGADVFRMNFSHGAHEDHQARLNILRGLEHKHGRPIGIILEPLVVEDLPVW